MVDRNDGHIVTVASCSAFSPIECWDIAFFESSNLSNSILSDAIPYSVSKTAALAIQEALENEVSAMGKNGVK